MILHCCWLFSKSFFLRRSDFDRDLCIVHCSHFDHSIFVTLCFPMVAENLIFGTLKLAFHEYFWGVFEKLQANRRSYYFNMRSWYHRVRAQAILNESFVFFLQYHVESISWSFILDCSQRFLILQNLSFGTLKLIFFEDLFKVFLFCVYVRTSWPIFLAALM